MPSYLVETYLAHGLDGQRAARELHARCIHVPEDELCFYVFEAPSADEASLVARRGGLDPIRVVEAVAS